MRGKIALLLLVVILVAGCTGSQQIPGLDALIINQETSVEGEKNVLVIKDLLLIPKSPVLTDQSVQFSFILENKDGRKTAENVIVDLFDAPLMKNSEKNSCNLPSGRSCFANERAGACSDGCPVNNILPFEQRQISYDLFTPSYDEIAGLKTESKMNFLTRYDFEGSTSFTVPVVNEEEIKARQRAGDKVKVDVLKSIGSGPVQIDPELFGSPFILAGQSGTFFFAVKNKGSGNLYSSKVGPGGLCIYFQKEFFGDATTLITPDGAECTKGECVAKTTGPITGGGGGPDLSVPTGGGQFTADVIAKYLDEVASAPITGMATGAAGEAEKEPLFVCVPEGSAKVGCHKDSEELKNRILCYNKRDIELYRDESRVSMRFSIHKVFLEKNVPFKSMTVLARIRYPYEVRDSVDLTIIPARE